MATIHAPKFKLTSDRSNLSANKQTIEAEAMAATKRLPHSAANVQISVGYPSGSQATESNPMPKPAIMVAPESAEVNALNEAMP